MGLRQIVITAAVLALFSVLGTGLVAVTFDGTRARIAANERATLLRNVHALIPPTDHDNDVFTDTVEVRAPEQLGTPEPVTVYRARKDGRPVAAILTPVAPDGYSGDIRLLVGIRYDGTLAGVRVLAHRETPGLGDAIEEQRSDWILGFANRSLDNPQDQGWAVRRDGGEFDQFAGATITPRAAVNAVHRSLLYFRDHRDELFECPAPAGAPASPPADGKCS